MGNWQSPMALLSSPVTIGDVQIMSHPRAATVGQLKETGYKPSSVKDELRRNVIRKLKAGEELFPGIVGYRDTVIPQIINGILSKHDLLFLGLRGQAKTRILRMLPTLLDEWMPVLAGVEINDDPVAPMTKTGKRIISEQGDDAAIEWVHRDDRYQEKLATPDVTIADLIGEIDLVKHAEGRYLSDESTMHYGLIPRSNRGLFAINELPDLAPRIQVGLFNVLEERDVQIRGYPIRLDLDVCLVFSANPAVGVMLGIRAEDQAHVQIQPERIPANLHIPLLQHIEQADLNARRHVLHCVDGENPAIGTRDQAIVHRRFIRKIPPFGMFHQVDLPDQIRDGDIRRRQFFLIPIAAMRPLNFRIIRLLGDDALSHFRGRGDRV